MKSYVAMKLEVDGNTVMTPRGRVGLTPLEMRVFAALKAGGRVCVSSLIERYSLLSPHDRLEERRMLNTHVNHARRKLRSVGLDLVTIRGWGYRLGEVHAANAKNTNEEPTHSEKEMLKAIEEGRKPVVAQCGLSDFDRERIRNLSARGLSLTGIASMIRKPYAAIAAELRAAR